jgi:hypothetical protein
MYCLWSVVAIVVVGCITPASAQVQNVNRTASGQPDTDIRVGVYVNVRPDCTSGPLPSIQLTSPPENGKVTVKKAKVTATNYKQCLALEVPAFVAFYRSRGFRRRRCFNVGGEVSRWQDASAADQYFGRKRIAGARHLKGSMSDSVRSPASSGGECRSQLR